MKKILSSLAATLLLVLGLQRASAQHIWTQHNDQERTGWYKSEGILKQSNVSKNTFGLKFTCTTDDAVHAQPLIMMNFNVPGVGTKNVIFLATVNNSIYCYDAETNGNPYWTKNYTNENNLGGGSRPATATDIHPSLCNGSYGDFTGQMGIVGTPVIDTTTNTMYFVTKVAHGSIDNDPWQNGVKKEYTYLSTGFHQFLHAIDISNGNDRAGSPVEITASAPGTGDGNVGNVVSLDPRRNFNRAGLALANGKVYIAFAAHCDMNPSHGWMLAYDKTTLGQVAKYITTPDDGRGGIWMAGGAPAIDAAGNIYFTSGNSLNEPDDPDHDFNTYPTKLPSDIRNRGESVIKLNANLALQDYFTPHDYEVNNDLDLDFGQQVMIIPGTGKIMTGIKSEKLYVMSQTALGGYDAATDHIQQTINLPNGATGHSNFVYYGGTAQHYIYQYSEKTPITAYPVSSSGVFGAGVAGDQSVPSPSGLAGAYLSLSSNNLDPATAVLWSYMPLTSTCVNNFCDGIVRAFNALDVTKKLWDNTMNAADGIPGGYAKMVPPVIALGNVYIPTLKNKVMVYGLATGANCAINVALGKTASSDGSAGGGDNVTCCQPDLAFDNDASFPPSRWSGNGANSNYLQVDLGAQYDICKIAASFEHGGWPKDFSFTVSTDGTTFQPVYTKTDFDGPGSGYYNEISGTFTGRYVRFQGITRGTPYPYSVFELQVYGSPVPACGPPANVVNTPVNDSTETISWAAIPGATQYIFKYRPDDVNSYVTRVVTNPTVTITHLDCGRHYTTSIQTACGAGNSTITQDGFTMTACAASACSDLPTRIFSADLGDVGFDGWICLNGGVYSIKGSGGGIGGTSDQFRWFWNDPNGDATDKEVSARLINQDQVTANNKMGVMIRSHKTDNSAFAFLGSVHNGQSFVFEYRATDGGPVTTTSLAGHTLPYFARLTKSGSNFIASGSTDGTNWTILNGPVNVSTFGSDVGNTPYYGLGITSTGNAALSGGSFDMFKIGSSTPLPIKLTAFKAANIDNDHVLVSWTTTMEQNVDHFELQRSGSDGVFHVIGTIDAAGNSDLPINYIFNDNAPISGTNFYRLNEIDLDNKSYLSPVTHVDFGLEKELQIYPNPVSTYVSITSGTEPLVEATLYDVSGKALQVKTSTTGSRVMKLNTAGLAKGIYILRVRTKAKTYQQKIVKE